MAELSVRTSLADLVKTKPLQNSYELKIRRVQFSFASGKSEIFFCPKAGKKENLPD